MVRQCFVCRRWDYRNPELSFHRFPTKPQILRDYLSILNMDFEKQLPRYPLICSAHFKQSDIVLRGKTKQKSIKKGALPLPFESSSPDTSTYSDSSESTVDEAPPISQIAELEFDIKHEDDESCCSTMVRLKQESDSTLTASECSASGGEEHNNADILHDEDVLAPGVAPLQSPVTSEPDVDDTGEVDQVFAAFHIPLSIEKKRRTTANSFSSLDLSNPKRAEYQFKLMQLKLTQQKSKIKMLQQSVRRLKARVNTLSSRLREKK